MVVVTGGVRPALVALAIETLVVVVAPVPVAWSPLSNLSSSARLRGRGSGP